MKILVIVLTLATLACASVEWTNLRVTWKLQRLDPDHSASFYEIPRTLHDVVAKGWVQVDDSSNSLPTTLHCVQNDPRFCVILDLNGNIAGLQINLPASDLENVQNKYHMLKIEEYELKEIFGVDVWSSTVYTVSPDIIKAGGRNELNNLTGVDKIWIKRTDGYMEIPKNISALDPNWTQEGCVNEQGTHYLYNISTELNCDNFKPWFLLIRDDELVGVGFIALGNTSMTYRDWYEVVPVTVLRPIIPKIPQCYIDLATEWNVRTLKVMQTPISSETMKTNLVF